MLARAARSATSASSSSTTAIDGPKEIGVGPEFLNWLTDPQQNGAGALFDFGCYGVDLATWIMHGELPLTVTAVTLHIKPEIYPNVDDDSTIVLTYPHAQAIIQGSWNWPFNRKDMEVYGANGYVDTVYRDKDHGNTSAFASRATPPTTPRPRPPSPPRRTTPSTTSPPSSTAPCSRTTTSPRSTPTSPSSASSTPRAAPPRPAAPSASGPPASKHQPGEALTQRTGA